MLAKKYALLIGIRIYPNIPVSRGGPLAGCHNDVEAMYELLESRGFDDLRVLTDPVDDCTCRFCQNPEGAVLPTRQGIRDALERLIDDVSDEDLVAFYFSGHGSEIQGRGLFAGQRFQTLVTHDSGRGDAPNKDLADREIEQWLQRLGTAAHSATLIFDNCYSGGITGLRGASLGSVKQVEADDREIEDLDPDLVRALGQPRESLRPPVIALSACAAGELSSETKVDGKARGLFTSRLVDVLRESDAARWSEIFPEIAELVASENLHQHPRREGEGPIFAAGDVDPDDIWPPDTIELKKLAIVIGIDYQRPDPLRTFPPLQTPADDAREIARVLEEEQGYEIVGLSSGEPGPLLNERATRKNIHLLIHRLARIKVRSRPDSAVVIYFAGHGITREQDGMPTGYLVPWDAGEDPSTWLPMKDLRDHLVDGISDKERLAIVGRTKSMIRLMSRHLLLVLDCCFGGAMSFDFFRGSSTRDRPIYYSEYKRFVEGTAWQLLSSASFNQQALDRDPRNPGQRHSPFVEALIEALSSESADFGAGGRRDHLVTATELHTFIDTRLRRLGVDIQTPALLALRPLRGQYIFRVPGFEPTPLPDPPLDPDSDPWNDNAGFFYERREVLRHLLKTLFKADRPVAVVGPSGCGKTRLLHDGLRAFLEQFGTGEERNFLVASGVMDLLDPHESEPEPDHVDSYELAETVEEAETKLKELAAHCYLLVLLDPMPENLDDTRLRRLLANDHVRVLASARSAPDEAWQTFTLPVPSSEELRAVLETPAAANVLFFESPELVTHLLDSAAASPTPISLLSATLSEMYRAAWKRRGASDRELSEQDLPEGIGGMLARRAEALTSEFRNSNDLIRRIFLRLAVPQAGHPCRPVNLGELETHDPVITRQIHEIIDRFIERRVLVLGEHLEVAHEELIPSWASLQQWRRDAGELPELLFSTWTRAAQWDADGREEGKLWQKDPAIHLLRGSSELGDLEKAFVEASYIASRGRLARSLAEMSGIGGLSEDWSRKALLAAHAGELALEVAGPKIMESATQRLLGVLHATPLSIPLRLPGRILGMKFLRTENAVKLAVRTARTTFLWDLDDLGVAPERVGEERVGEEWVEEGEGAGPEARCEDHVVRLRSDQTLRYFPLLHVSIPEELIPLLAEPQALLGHRTAPGFMVFSEPTDPVAWLATGADTRGESAEIRLWRLDDLSPLPTSSLAGEGLQALTSDTSRTGSLRALINREERAELWSGDEKIWNSRGPALCLALSPDAKSLVYAEKGGALRLIPTKSPREQYPTLLPSRFPSYSPVRGLSFSADSESVIVHRQHRVEICPIRLERLILLARGAAGRRLREIDLPADLWSDLHGNQPPQRKPRRGARRGTPPQGSPPGGPPAGDGPRRPTSEPPPSQRYLDALQALRNAPRTTRKEKT